MKISSFPANFLLFYVFVMVIVDCNYTIYIKIKSEKFKFYTFYVNINPRREMVNGEIDFYLLSLSQKPIVHHLPYEDRRFRFFYVL